MIIYETTVEKRAETIIRPFKKIIRKAQPLPKVHR